MNGENDLNRDVDVDLGGIFSSLWRNKGRLLLSAIIVTILTFLVLQVVSPRYKSEARILIRNSDPVLAAPANNIVVQQSDLDDPGIASQVQLLQSRSIAAQVIAELDLKSAPEFDGDLNRSILDVILSFIGLSDGGRGVTADDRVLEAYYERMSVFQADRARVIVVQFWSKDPRLAAAVPNLVSQKYLELQEELKRGAGPAELDKLEPELKKLRASVVQAEAAVADFRESSDLLQGRDNETLATQELSELSTELGRVRAQLSQAEANAAAVSRALEAGSLDAASSVLQSPLIQRLQERQANLNAQLADLSTTLLSGHPRIQRLRSQIQTLDRQINTQARRIEESLQEEAEVARAREQDLLARRNQLKSESGRVGRAQVQLRSLEREADAQRQLLNAYLVRFKEAKARQNRQFVPADAYIFSKAQVQSKPFFPKKGPILAGAFFGTLLLGSMIVLSGAVMSGAATRREQETPAHRKAGVPVFGETRGEEPVRIAAPPIAPSMESITRPVSDEGTVALAAAAKSLLMLGKARVAILSPDADTSSANAVSLARLLAGQRVSAIVLDMTGHGASSELMIGNAAVPGITNLMAGNARLSQAIHADEDSTAHIMPSGDADPQLAAAGADRLETIIEALQKTYDYLIVDCGSADVSSLRRVSDIETVNILSVPQGEADSARIASERLKKAGYRAPLIVTQGRTQDEDA